ncbi:MAG: hypothetical protein JOY83_25610 [Alphaproteobacteria bacterium]|nr:hypothetical protein [Alphaproteobacteria bacterium]
MMFEPGKEPSPNELLERIVRLEAKVAQLGHAQAKTATTTAKLTKDFQSEVNSTTDHFKSIYQYLADIHDQLWPLVHKVFPGSTKTQNQIANIIRNGGRSWDDKSTDR